MDQHSNFKQVGKFIIFVKMKENQMGNANLQNHPSFQSKFKAQKPSIKVDYKVIHVNKDEDLCKRKDGRKQFSQKVDSNISALEMSNSRQLISRVKSVEGSRKNYASGKFVGSQYLPLQQGNLEESQYTTSQHKAIEHKTSLAKVTQSGLRFQISKSVQQSIKGQYIKKNQPSCFVSTLRVSKLKTQNDRNVYKSRVKTQKQSMNVSKYSSSNYESIISQRNKLPSYSNEGIKDIIEYEHAGKYKQEKLTPKCIGISSDTHVKDKFRAFNQIHEFDFRKRLNTLSNEVRLTKFLR